jgi:hypothetical protein
MFRVNGTLPTIVIVAGLALAGYALLMTALNRRMGIGLLAALGALEILLLVLVGVIVARLAGGERPAGIVRPAVAPLFPPKTAIAVSQGGGTAWRGPAA